MSSLHGTKLICLCSMWEHQSSKTGYDQGLWSAVATNSACDYSKLGAANLFYLPFRCSFPVPSASAQHSFDLFVSLSNPNSIPVVHRTIVKHHASSPLRFRKSKKRYISTQWNAWQQISHALLHLTIAPSRIWRLDEQTGLWSFFS
jgi:hypothetical protein